MKINTQKARLLRVLLALCMILSLVPISAFAESGAYAVKFYPGDYGTMTKNDQIPFVYYGIDDDVNKPYYYKLQVSETETSGFAGSIIDTLLPNSGYEFAYWTADAAVYQAGSGTAIPAGTPLSSDQMQNKITVKSDVTFTAHFRQISEHPEDSVITAVEINNATISFKDGDKPVFTGEVPKDAGYAFRCEWWSLDENTGIISTEPEWGSDIYKNKITAFEAGKTYHYGVYVTAYTADISPDATLKINGQEVNYTRIGDDGDTQSFWVETELTMIPMADSHTHSYGTAWKSDDTNHWHECQCGDKADTAAHSFRWVIDKEATATEKGSKHEECTVCGYKRSENTVIGKLPGSGSTGNTGSGDNNTHKPGKDSSTKSPQTGDSSLIGWLAALLVSGSAAAWIALTGKKAKKRS